MFPTATPDPATIQLSTFEPTASNVTQNDADTLEIVLQVDETVTILGEYDLAVLAGIVTVYGTVIRPSPEPVRVFSPSIAALPQIQARHSNTTVRITSVTSGLRKLEKLSPLFRNIWTSTSTDRSFELLGSSADDHSQRSLEALDLGGEADAVLRTISAKSSVESRRPRIMAMGAKASGKSTFNRMLWNHLQSWTYIKKCCYLDIDPGQPEFTPSGLVSIVEVTSPLLGPPYTHTAAQNNPSFTLIRSHAIATTSFKDDPEHYKACVLDLARHVDKRRPLIVNSCGWVSGQGASVLLDLLSELDISDAVLLEPLDVGLLESLQQSSPSTAFYRIPRRPQKTSSRTPAEQRAMQTMAYFHSRLDLSTNRYRWSGKAISRIRPWLVDYAGNESGIAAIVSYGQNPTTQFLAEVLNGSIVALVVMDEDEAEELTDNLIRTPEDLPLVRPDDQGIQRTLTPSRSHCIGLALVRGIDVENKQIHLVTPLGDSQIAALATKKVVLVRGGFDSPEWAYLEDLHKDPDSAASEPRPWVGKKGLVGIEGAVWRLRHPPMASVVLPWR